MFVRTMIDPGNADYWDRSGRSVGKMNLFPGRSSALCPLRAILLSVLSVMSLSGCGSSFETVPIPDPYYSGVRHFDVAFVRIQDEDTADLVTTYTDASLRFTETSRVDRAQGTLRTMDNHLLGRNGPIDISSTVDRVAAWHALAGKDETVVPAARQYTSEILGEISRLAKQDGVTAASELLRVLKAQLSNPNLQEDSVRRTLDELYLINDDAARVAALVRAAETIVELDDIRTLNPVVQQSIAMLPVIESPLLGASLGIRLAVLSIALDRPGDVNSLLDQARRRSEEGLIVDDESFHHIEEMIHGMNAIEASGKVPRSVDPFTLLNGIVSNVSPQSMRLRSQGAVTLAFSEEGVPTDLLLQMIRIGDPETRAAVSAEFIRNRARRYPDWAPGQDISTLLGNAGLVGLEPTARVGILADLAAAYYYAGQPEEFDRLRGLIGSIDEYNRVLIVLAEEMMDTDRLHNVRRALDAMSGVPAAGPFDGPSPRYRVVSLYRRLGDYDRAIFVAEGLSDVELSRFLVSLPADFLPNPVSNAVLDRMAER